MDDGDNERLNLRLLKQLGRTAAGGSAGAESGGGPDVRALSSTMARDGSEALRGALARQRLREADTDLKARIVAEGRLGLEKLQAEGAKARLEPLQRAAVEAVILTDGSRPVLFVRGGAADRADIPLGEWKLALDKHDDHIRQVTPSVGRIGIRQSRYRYQGTGFVVGDGLLLTNRHVLQLIGVEESPGKWSLYPDATIDFSGELTLDGGVSKPDLCELLEVVNAGDDPIVSIDPTRLDMALLRFVDKGQAHKPLAIASKPNRLWPEAPLYVVGFPAAADVFYGDDTPYAGTETAEIMTRLFMDEFGVKRFAPGRIDTPPGEVADGDRSWVIEHDASTLGGNSGSLIVDFADGVTAVGLHFGGGPRKANYGHVLAALKDRLKPLGVNYV